MLRLPGSVDGSMPAATGPVHDFRVEQTPELAAIHLAIDVDARVEIERAGAGLVVEVHSPAHQTGAHMDVAELYPLLFPSGSGRAAPPPVAGAIDDGAEAGWWLGPLLLRPGITARYVNSNSVFIDGPEPTRVQYLEVQPIIDGWIGHAGGDGRVSLSYAPRFRTGSSEDVVNSTTHALDAGLTYAFSPGSGLGADYRFVSGTLETREVDPGGEFFFGLQPFTRHGVSGSLDAAIGGVWGVGVGGDWNWIDIQQEEESGFFSHQRGGVDANLWRDLSPTLRLRAGYRRDELPAPESRPIAESSADSAYVSLDGELSPTLRASLRLGYRRQENPALEGPGSSFSGLTYRGTVTRDFSWSSLVRLGLFRGTLPSAFQTNSFYVSTGAGLSAQFPLPLRLSAVASLEYRRNSYERPTLVLDPDGNAQLSDPRSDDLFGWSVGLARALGRWGFIRADYRQQNRDSNVPAFRNDTETFVLQLGFNPFLSSSGQP